MAASPPDDGRLPWLDTVAPASANSRTALVLKVIGGLMLLGLFALVGLLIGRWAVPRQPTRVTPAAMTTPLAPARSVPVTVAASPAPAIDQPVPNAPALARADQQAGVTAPRPPMLHLRPEQIRAVRQIALAPPARPRQGPPPPVTAYAPSVGAPGHVVQLGAYDSASEAETAAALFRYKYRGLLAILPKAVLPYRPNGAKRMLYRVQFIAPSQLYAEVTCQRIRATAKSCVVVY